MVVLTPFGYLSFTPVTFTSNVYPPLPSLYNDPDKGIYIVYSLECNAARTPLCLVAQKVTQCETEMIKKG